jgi:hypothetical protein
MKDSALDVEAFKSRLLCTGHPRSTAKPSTPGTGRVTRGAQEAGAELREHIIADIWALIDALESRGNGCPVNRFSADEFLL